MRKIVVIGFVLLALGRLLHAQDDGRRVVAHVTVTGLFKMYVYDGTRETRDKLARLLDLGIDGEVNLKGAVCTSESWLDMAHIYERCPILFDFTRPRHDRFGEHTAVDMTCVGDTYTVWLVYAPYGVADRNNRCVIYEGPLVTGWDLSKGNAILAELGAK